MLNGRWNLEFAFVQIISGICISPDVILSVDYFDGRWPLKFFLVQILSGIIFSQI